MFQNALGRIASYISTNKLKLIMNAFLSLQFEYCSLVLMFHNQSLNNKFNKLQEQTLHLVYKDARSSFNELLEKREYFPNSSEKYSKTCNWNLLAIEIDLWIVWRNGAPKNLRNDHTFRTYIVKTAHYRTETVSFLGPKIWSLFPSNMINPSNI